MSRTSPIEVRVVSANWRHPKDEAGRFIPLCGGNYKKDTASWDEKAEQWKKGFLFDALEREWKRKESYCSHYNIDIYESYEEVNGPRPQADQYMPNWSESERTHYQLYWFNGSEGTPLFPVMESMEVLVQWVTENAFKLFVMDNLPRTYDGWFAELRENCCALVT